MHYNSVNIEAILIQMNTYNHNKPPNNMLQFQLVSNITFYRVIENLIFFLQFVDGPLFAFVKKCPLKYMRSNMVFRILKFQDVSFGSFLDIGENV